MQGSLVTPRRPHAKLSFVGSPGFLDVVFLEAALAADLITASESNPNNTKLSRPLKNVEKRNNLSDTYQRLHTPQEFRYQGEAQSLGPVRVPRSLEI